MTAVIRRRFSPTRRIARGIISPCRRWWSDGDNEVMLAELSLVAARDGLRRGDFTAAELTLAHLEAIEALNPRLNAFITVSHSQALAQAEIGRASCRERV